MIIDLYKQTANCLVQEILSGLQTCRTGTNECVSDVALLLNDGDADLLEAATSLHYVGMFINHKSYHKHSYYLIKVDLTKLCNAFDDVAHLCDVCPSVCSFPILGERFDEDNLQANCHMYILYQYKIEKGID